MAKQTDPFTYEYRDGSFATVGMEELFDRQAEHDDLRIKDRFIEYDAKNKDNVSYLTYILDKREDDGEWERYIKVVRLCKVYSVPKELREKKALMVSQDELLSAVWKSDTNFICIYCNMPDDGKTDSEDKSIKGFYYCYGVQVMMRVYGHYYGTGNVPLYYTEDTSEAEKIAQTLKVLKKQADAKYEALLKVLRGTFRQARFFPLTMKEAEAIRSTIEEAPQLQVIRGIPKTHISAASGVTTSLDGVTTTPEGIEQNEEFIRGMLHDKYANIIMAVPIPHDEILQWSQNTAKELSRYKSQYSGMISHNAGVSIPMVFAGNLSATMGNTHGITDTTGETIGNTQGTSDSVSHGVGTNQGTSHTVGFTQGQTLGVADSATNSTTDTNSQGLSRSQTFSDSRGISQSVSDGITHGVTNTESIGRSHTVGQSESYGESETLSRSQSHSIGKSTTVGNTFGETLGQTQGITKGHTVGNTIGHTVGNTIGTTYGTTEGYTTGHTVGTTEGNTTGRTITNGDTYGTSQSHGGSNTVSNGISHSNSIGNSTTISQNMSHSLGQSATNTVGTSSNVGSTWGSSWNQGSNQNGSIGGSNTVTENQSYTNQISDASGHSINGNVNAIIAGVTGGFSDSHGITTGEAYGGSTANGATWSTSGGTSSGYGGSSGGSVSQGFSQSQSLGSTETTSYGQGISRGVTQSESAGTSQSIANGTNWSNGTSNSHSHSIGNSTSHSLSNSISDSQSHSLSNSLSRSNSQSISDSMSKSISDSLSHSVSNSLSRGLTNSLSNSDSLSNSLANSHSFSRGTSLAQGVSEGWSEGLTHGIGRTHSVGTTVSDGISQSVSRGISDSQSHSVSNGVTHSQSVGNSVGRTDSLSHGQSTGMGKTASQGLTRSVSDGQGVTAGTSNTDSRSTGTTNSTSNSLSNSQGVSNAQSNALGTGQGLNFGIGPSIGVSRSYQVFDEQKGNIIKLLEASNTRWLLASRMGAFHVDMYVVSYTPEAMQGIAMTAVSSWGGDNEISTIQCVTPDSFTQNHLMKHASVFDPCSMKENTPNIADNYLWSTIMLSSELAALTHLPRVETGGISTVATNIPAFSIFANKTGEIYFGKQINYEDGLPSYNYFFSKKEFMHTLICGASGSGKTTSAVRMAREVIRNYKDMKIFALDWKNSWRVLKRFAPNGIDDFEFYGLDYTSVRPIRMNLFIPPKYVGATQWVDKVIESLCLGYGFGTKMFSVLKSAARISMVINGVFYYDQNEIPVEMPVTTKEELKEFNNRMAKVTLKQIYEIVRAMKDGQLKAGTNLANEISDITDSTTKKMVESKFVKSGMGMQDAYDSILAKLEGFYSGELRELYCEEDYDKCIHIEDLIDGKRIVVLEGGDLDSSTKKAVIELISHGLFMYSRLKKNRDKIVEKRFYILEEAHRIIDNPENGDASPLNVGETIFDIILNEAREYGVYAMIIVQTPNALPPAMVTNCAILIIHRLGNDKDITLMTQMLCRNARLDNRDVPIWLAKEPIGTAIVRLNNTVMHQDSEPCLVQVARCENEPPDNEELVLEMPDVDIPRYLRQRMNDDSYLQLYKDELDRFINHEDNEIDRMAHADDYHEYEVDVG